VYKFIANHQDQVSGVLSGFDRLVFRGTLRSVAHAGGMNQYLFRNEILLKNFGAHVEQVSQRLKTASLAAAVSTGRPVRYLASAKVSKEDIGRGLAVEDGIHEGLVCVLTSVERCRTFEIYRDRQAKHLYLQPRIRKCLFLDHYVIHPVFGFLNARIQTWFPFSIQLCLNGREWLARQMDQAGLAYARQDNCFPWIEDWTQAQQLMDQQLQGNWPTLLNDIALLGALLLVLALLSAAFGLALGVIASPRLRTAPDGECSKRSTGAATSRCSTSAAATASCSSKLPSA
jgi:hypothetical protein